ncbi:hypothetical protein [Maledivibacter halophilus]|uniref:hypothetical protein n=1 Tax=Maledivibacter halophilus TaxID=36842 RepID=UPI0009A89613|nr:hypothetical protein [Maledivibacter halophilus]
MVECRYYSVFEQTKDSDIDLAIYISEGELDTFEYEDMKKYYDLSYKSMTTPIRKEFEMNG